MRLHRWTANWGLKLSALALSILLWIVVMSAQVTARWRTVPVEVLVRDRTFGGRLRVEPATVRVRFAGAGRELWRLDSRRAVVVLAVQRPGASGVYDIEPRMLRVPAGISVSVLEIRPAAVRVVTSPSSAPSR